jgi:hypothetical protein
MTHDPSRRLVSLEQVMNGSNPFELIETPLGKMEKWRAETLLIGSTSGIQDVYRTIRDDAATQAARADEAEARNALIEHLCTKVVEFEQRFNDHEARLAAAEEQHRADQEREAEFNEEPIELPPDELPPDIAAHQELTPPTKIGDGAHDTHIPGGEMHTVAAKNEPPEPTTNDEELPEPPTEADANGGPPKSVPLSYVHAQDQTEFAIPEPGMTTDARKRKPRGGIVSQPTAISLNEG